MLETWLDIEGYEGLYLISNYGEVFSMKHGRTLLQANNGRDYRFVWLFKDGIKQRFYIHRLVASTFIPNPENKPQVNHKDCNKSNNNVTNLEWVNAYEQMQHASCNGRLYCSEYQKQQTAKANSGTNSHLSRLTDSDVREIREFKQSTGLPNVVIAYMFNVNRETVGYIVRGKTWKHLL